MLTIGTNKRSDHQPEYPALRTVRTAIQSKNMMTIPGKSWAVAGAVEGSMAVYSNVDAIWACVMRLRAGQGTNASRIITQKPPISGTIRTNDHAGKKLALRRM